MAKNGVVIKGFEIPTRFKKAFLCLEPIDSRERYTDGPYMKALTKASEKQVRMAIKAI